MTLFDYQLEGGIGTLLWTQPTMPPAFFVELGEVLDDLKGDPALRVLLIKSAGPAFSYGLDLPALALEAPKILAGGLAEQRLELLELIGRWQGAFQALVDLPVPVIAAVHSWCVGGGLDLVSACDIRLASADARFSLRETKLAIVADLGSLQRLPLIVGEGIAREMAFTGGDYDVDFAARHGLVSQVFDDRAALEAGALAMAQEIASNSAVTLRGVKSVLNELQRERIAASLRYVAAWNSAFLASEDLGQAIQSFLARKGGKRS